MGSAALTRRGVVVVLAAVIALLPIIAHAVNDRCGYSPADVNKTQNFGKCFTKEYCCSAFGYCGVGDQYCVGCQKGFGFCPKQCDEHTSFCGPEARASLALGIIGTVTGVIGSVTGVLGCLFACCGPFLRYVRAHRAPTARPTNVVSI